ncbi:MAG: hypothetical protein ACN4GW_08795 [Desulforhopalus sp.]
MAQFFHCFMLLYIVFVVAEIRNVLINGTPNNPEPITIWEEARPGLADKDFTLIYRL